MAYRSSGNSNTELCQNLRNYGIITDPRVFEAFVRVDRGMFVPEPYRREAYFDQPLLSGKIHMSAPHIYGSVVNSLDIKPGMSFLNIGSGTGYLSTIAGCLLQGGGVNHGIDLDADLLTHAREKHELFLREKTDSKSKVTPAEFFLGNIFDVDEGKSMRYDRIYVGAACPTPLKDKILKLLVPGRNGEGGGVLIGPMGDELVRITRESETSFVTTYLAAVRFAPLKPKPNLPVVLPRPVWSSQQHHTYPAHFRASVKTLMMTVNRPGNLASALPRSLWLEILSFTDRQWFRPEVITTKSDREIANRAESAVAAEDKSHDREGKRAKVRLDGDLSRRLAGRFHRLRQALWNSLGHGDSNDHPDGDGEGNNEDQNDGDNQGEDELFASVAAALMGTGSVEDGEEGDGVPRYMAMHGLLASLLLGTEALDDDGDDEEEIGSSGKMKAEPRDDGSTQIHKSAGTVAVTASGVDGGPEAMGSA